ncbi:MAG: septal ring lytic transglycosylase RlpA family protein [Brevinematia bacterium]
MKKVIFILFFLLVVKYSFSQFPKYLYGTISYYGDEFKGKKTANGEIFDPNKYTAAHKELPFGTEIMVENLENGRKVKVVINDRGPFVANRILDVSRIAAEELGFIRKGTTYAKITILKLGDGKISYDEEPYPKTSSSQSFSIGVTSSVSNMENFQINGKNLSSEQSSSIITPQGAYSNITYTNIVVITKTNEITITNTVMVPVTNIIEIPPYEDKIVEKEIKDKPISNTDEEFILSEPDEYPPLPVFSSSSSSLSSFASTSTDKTNFELMEKEVVIEPSTQSSSFSSFSSKESIVEENMRYYIQVGAFKEEKNALKVYDLLRKDNFPVFTTEEITKGTKWIKVRIGYFKSRNEAENVLKRLEKHKINGMILIAK